MYCAQTSLPGPPGVLSLLKIPKLSSLNQNLGRFSENLIHLVINMSTEALEPLL
jgi:hypothetical protein